MLSIHVDAQSGSQSLSMHITFGDQEGWYPNGAKTTADKLVPMGALIKAMLVNSGRYMTGTEANLNGNSGWYDQVYSYASSQTTACIMFGCGRVGLGHGAA
jgi:hypothetical protein